MKKYSKWLSLLLTGAMALSMTACGGGASTAAPASSTESASGAASETGTKDPKELVIGVMMKNNQDVNQRRTNEGVRTELDAQVAAGRIGKYIEVDGETDVQKQINQIEDLINMNVDAIIFAPAEATCDPVVDRAVEEGIPIVVLNSKTSNTDEKATAFVGSNDVNAGEIMANYVMEKFPNGAKVFHLQGVLGNSAAIDRTAGIHSILDSKTDKYPLVAELTAEWNREKATKIVEDWIQMYGKDGIDAIVCDNDDMSIAASLVCDTYGIGDKVQTIGIDAIDDARAMVKEGILDATVLQDVQEQGKVGAQFAVKLANGETVEKSYMIPFQLITGENIDEYWPNN